MVAVSTIYDAVGYFDITGHTEFENIGTISAVSFLSVATGASLIPTDGLIVGFVDMGGANDIYEGNGGRIIGTIGLGNGNDVLLGRSGADIFIFNAGIDVITDFTEGDLIDLQSFAGLSTFDDILALMVQDGDDTEITFNNETRLILQNFQLTDLDISDFII